MRNIHFEFPYLKNPSGSCLAVFGNTRVICTCTIEKVIPPFIKQGAWLTAEYAMLPGSVSTGRKKRDGARKDGRSVEIQRLIGRSLRAAVNLCKLPEVTLTVDCDVIQADGGTRTAAISGGWLALIAALTELASSQVNSGISEERKKHADKIPLLSSLPPDWVTGRIVAVSVGIVKEQFVCDLDYEEDSHADVDMNIVSLNDDYVEIQGTGENGVFDRRQLDALLDTAQDGLVKIAAAQDDALHEYIL